MAGAPVEAAPRPRRAGPGPREHGPDFEEARPQAFDAAQAARVLVEAGGDADLVAEREPAPREGVRRRAPRQRDNLEDAATLKRFWTESEKLIARALG